MIATGQLKEEDREDIQDILLAKHRHQHQKKRDDKGGMSIVRSMAEIGRRASAKNIDPKGKLLYITYRYVSKCSSVLKIILSEFSICLKKNKNYAQFFSLRLN